MCRFIETVRIDRGVIRNLAYHDRRMNDTLRHFWPGGAGLRLEDHLLRAPQAGTLKARVLYGAQGVERVDYTPYAMREVRSLQIVHDDSVDYAYKSADRSRLDRLFSLRGACDEILIVRRGLLTDTSFTNIALFDGSAWYTPARPLLRGTKRAELLDKGILSELDIPVGELHRYVSLRLFNAMIDWGELEIAPLPPGVKA